MTDSKRNAADDFLEDFEGGDDDSVSGDEKAPENKNSSPNGSASSSNTGEDPSAISRRRLNEIVQMGMSGAASKSAADPPKPKSKPPVPLFAKPKSSNGAVAAKPGDAPPGFPGHQQTSSTGPPPGYSGSEDAPPGFPGDAPPGFRDAPPDFPDQKSEKDKPHGNESSTDRPGQPPPGFGGSRKRERDEQSSSTKPTNVKRRQAKTPKVTVREVSERDWARVDSILDLAFSRVKPQDASSRSSLRASLLANPLVRAIASSEKLKTRFNKMVEETIDIEDHFKPHRQLLLEAARI
ncbi:hypothetical protein AAMO2058_001155400 [Amorphochlora amoebiformis]